VAVDFKKTVAIDIGSRYLKVAVIADYDPEEGIELEDFNIVELPEESFVSTYPEKPLVASKEIEDVLKTVITELKLKGKDAIIAIPDSLTFVNWVSVPLKQADNKELAEQVETKLQPVLTQELENYYYDWIKVSDEDKNNILTQAIFRDTLMEIGSMIQRLGLVPVAIDSTFFTMLHVFYDYLERKAGKGQNVSIVYLGHETTTIAIFRDTHLRTIRKLNIGGEKISKILMSQLSISMEEAERMKQEDVFFEPDNPAEQNKIKNYAIIRPVFGELIKELYNSFDSYLAKWREFKIDEIILTGGTSNFTKIDKAIQQHLNIPIRRGEEFIKVDCEKGIVPDEVNLLLPSIGALLR
jgi:type IV pilus assembly protein PilM